MLGSHEGSWRYTIGQRRGLRIGTPAADGRPRYVLDIEPVSGTVTVGPRSALSVDGLEAIRPRWCGTAPAPGVRLECTVQLRAHGEEHRAVVTADDDAVEVDLLDPASGDRARPGGGGVRRLAGRSATISAPPTIVGSTTAWPPARTLLDRTSRWLSDVQSNIVGTRWST